MPLARAMRKLPMLAALLGFVAAFVWLDNDNAFKREAYQQYSLHNIADAGVSLAFRYLKESRDAKAPAVRELNRMVEFAAMEPNAVMLRIAPEIKPGEREKRRDDENKKDEKLGKDKKDKEPAPPTDGPLLSEGEKNWVEKGGRLVLALGQNYGPVKVSNPARPEPIEKTLAVWPDVKTFHPTPNRIVTLKGEALDNAVALFTMKGGLFAARVPFGEGEVIVMASPEIFTNGNLGRADNLRLLMELAPPDRPVYFDEFVHGLRGAPGVGELLTQWGLGMALMVLGVGSVILFWRARTPIGPPEDDHRETRTEAIDFVNALAPLYNRALEPQQAIGLYYANFVRTVTAQSGLRGAELREKIFKLLGTNDEAALSGQRPLKDAEFSSLLQTLNDAYGRLERAHRR